MNAEKQMLHVESTGEPGLDRILGGGIPARSIVLIAGEPGSGKTLMTLQTLFHTASRGKKCLYITTISEPAIKVMQYGAMFDFFVPEHLEKQVIFADLGESLRSGAEQTFSTIEALVEKHQPAFVAIDSFRAIGERLRGSQDLRRFTYDLAVQMASWGATTFLVGEYAPAEYSSFAEFAIADGIVRLGSERLGLTSVREIEILKLRGAAYSAGQHFFDITSHGVVVYPRVSTPVDTPNVPSPATSERIRTGIPGLDELLAGGIPRDSATLVQGGTGTGKTLLGLQFLLEGAKNGEKGILFTMEETPDQLRAIAGGLGWNLAALEERGCLVIKYTSPVELSTDRFLHDARNQVSALGARRAVFDSLTTMALGVPSDRRYKEMVYAIAKHMRTAQVSLLMTVESEQLLGAAQLSGHGVSFIADNLVQLRYVELEGRLERAISVLKARGIQHNSELRAFTIGADGIRVVPERFKGMRGVLTGLPTRDGRSPE